VAPRQEEERELDVGQLQRSRTQVFLKQARIGNLDTVPPSPLRKEGRRHQENDVPAAHDSFPERFEGSLAARIMMLIEPRGMVGIL
jgi:hypothetical protein